MRAEVASTKNMSLVPNLKVSLFLLSLCVPSTLILRLTIEWFTVIPHSPTFAFLSGSYPGYILRMTFIGLIFGIFKAVVVNLIAFIRAISGRKSLIIITVVLTLLEVVFYLFLMTLTLPFG